MVTILALVRILNDVSLWKIIRSKRFIYLESSITLICTTILRCSSSNQFQIRGTYLCFTGQWILKVCALWILRSLFGYSGGLISCSLLYFEFFFILNWWCFVYFCLTITCIWCLLAFLFRSCFNLFFFLGLFSFENHLFCKIFLHAAETLACSNLPFRTLCWFYLFNQLIYSFFFCSSISTCTQYFLCKCLSHASVLFFSCKYLFHHFSLLFDLWIWTFAILQPFTKSFYILWFLKQFINLWSHDKLRRICHLCWIFRFTNLCDI